MHVSEYKKKGSLGKIKINFVFAAHAKMHYNYTSLPVEMHLL